MAAVANQVRSTAQQIGARIGWNPIDAATQLPTGTRERVPNLSDPRTDHRNLGFEDSCLSSAPRYLCRLPLYMDGEVSITVRERGTRVQQRGTCESHDSRKPAA